MQHLRDKKQKENFLLLLQNNTTLLTRLRDILQEELDQIFREESSGSTDYEDTDWAFKQADRNGQKRQIRRLLELLAFIGDK